MNVMKINTVNVNDRVSINDCTFYNIKNGDLGTVLFENFDLAFVNTDNSNSYNFKVCDQDTSITCQHGIWIGKNKLTVIIPTTKPSRRAWTHREDEYLYTYYTRKSVMDIAEHLDRSFYSVQSRARTLKIRNHQRREFNDRDCRFIVHTVIDPEFTVNEIGRQLHRSKSTINGRIALMNSRNELPSYKSDVA